MIDRSELDAVLDEVARGNRDAFRRVVRAYGLPLRSYLASQTHNQDDVDDLAQETLLTAFRNLASFRRGDDFGAWLRGVARNKLREHWRRTNRYTRRMDEFREEVGRAIEADLDRAVTDDRAEVIERLLRCIGELPEKLRRVARGGLDGDKPAQLAAALETTVGAVYNLHYRACQLLRVCLQKEPG
jgi:RNA polymerase sigma-70 factor, ECF subfamily